jgi:uncharacterized membrane protein (DUF106 family)
VGLLDLPAPVFSWADGLLGNIVSPLPRILLWGALGAVVSMLLYWLLSPQHRMEKIAAKERELKVRLKDDSIEMGEGLAASKDLLKLALSRMGIVLVPVLLATLPLISLMTWLDSHYAYRMPLQGESAEVSVEPNVAQGRWVAAATPPRVEAIEPGGKTLASLPMVAAVPVVEKWTWWNALIGNPLGYLPEASPINRIGIGLMENQYLSFGPGWLRGWLAPFLLAVLVVSLFIKIVFRIH